MRIGIISAMAVEQTALLEHFNVKGNTKRVHGMDIVRFEVFNHTVYCVLSGIGKVNAALSAAMLLQAYQCDVILNSGVAGGIKQPIGTIVLSSEVAYHDVDVTNFGNYQLGQLPNMPLKFRADTALLDASKTIATSLGLMYKSGLIASGDQFVTRLQSIQDFLNKHADLEAIDMEAAAIAHAAYNAKVPFLVIRSISDLIVSDNQQEDYETFFKESALKAAKLMGNLVATL